MKGIEGTMGSGVVHVGKATAPISIGRFLTDHIRPGSTAAMVRAAGVDPKHLYADMCPDRFLTVLTPKERARLEESKHGRADAVTLVVASHDGGLAL